MNIAFNFQRFATRIGFAYLLLFGFYSNRCFSQNITTIAGTGAVSFSGDGGSATLATFNHPIGLAIDASGNIYIADSYNNRIRKINTSGVISTFAGNGIGTFGGDGGLATAASLSNPYGVAVDNMGNVYIGDRGNQRVRKVTPAGIITTVAGTGVAGYSGDGSSATLAQVWNPTYLRTDNSNNVYFSDNQNHRIRKINSTTGIITTVAGNGIAGYSGDGGPATAAALNSAAGVFIDGAGNLYICQTINGAIRKVDVAGNISTIAGTGTSGYSGDGGAATLAKLNDPEDITLDPAGNIYIADNGNSRIRKINTAGVIYTIAGTGTPGFGGDGGPAIAALLNGLNGLALNSTGYLHIVDVFNSRVRRLGPNNNAPSFTAGAVGYLSICIGETPTSINTLLSVLDLDVSQTLTWSVVTAPLHGALGASYTATSTGSTVVPVGTYYMPAAGYTGGDMFKVQVYDGIAYDTITINVTISAPPTAGVISGTGTVCVGGTTALTAISGGTWTTSVPAVSFVSSTGVVTGLAAGLDTVLYIVSNFCGSDTARMPVTVLPLPDAGTISGTDSVCVGSSVTLSETATGGAWSHYVAGVSSVGGSGVVTGVAGGIDTVVYTVTNSCGSTAATFSVKVLPLANAGIITGVDSVCPGTTVTLSETVTGGVWSNTAGGLTTVSSTGVVTGVTTGIDTIAYTVTNFCGTAKAIRVVKVLSINFCHYLSVENAVNNQEGCMIYPNPSNGSFNVLISSPTSKEVKLQLTDVAGRKLNEFALRTNTTTELSLDIAPGIYLLNVVSDRGVISRKIIVTPQEP